MAMKPKHRIAVLWDLDGTIVDSIECFHLALEKLIENHHLPFSISFEDYKTRFFGTTFKEILNQRIPDICSEEEIDLLVEEYFDLSIQYAREGHISLIPGVDVILEELSQHNVPMAIASSSNMQMIVAELQALDLLHYFTNIISGSSLPSKPAPDIFLVAASSMNHSPGTCVAIEDSIAGIHSAINAGIRCVGITTSRKADDIQDADLVIDHYNQLSMERLMGLIQL